MSSDYYSRDGHPITMTEWCESSKTPGSRTVAKTTTRNETVSTVWLGLNHSWEDNGPPLTFETLVFGGPLDQQQERYSTEAEAVAGHHRWVAAATAANMDDVALRERTVNVLGIEFDGVEICSTALDSEGVWTVSFRGRIT